MKVSNYSNIHQLGGRETTGLFIGPVVIQEKIDGSQFSFANVDGELRCRSKNNAVGDGGNAEGMFGKVYKTAKAIFDTGTLPVGMVVRGECLDKPKHNVLAYGRIPVGNIIVYDIENPQRSGEYLRPAELEKQVTMWGLEVVPTLDWGEYTIDRFQKAVPVWLEKESVLGSSKIEGVVVKNYLRRDSEDNILMGKFVSAQFKEKMTGKPHNDKLAPVDQIISEFNREAIWQKALQHCREDGKLAGNPKDIGTLVQEIKDDFKKENGQDVIDRLTELYYREIEKGILFGFPQWYKQKLLENAELS
jgi:hypothetical protein